MKCRFALKRNLSNQWTDTDCVSELHLPDATFYVQETPIFLLDWAYTAIPGGICPVHGRILLRYSVNTKAFIIFFFCLFVSLFRLSSTCVFSACTFVFFSWPVLHSPSMCVFLPGARTSPPLAVLVLPSFWLAFYAVTVVAAWQQTQCDRSCRSPHLIRVSHLVQNVVNTHFIALHPLRHLEFRQLCWVICSWCICCHIF